MKRSTHRIVAAVLAGLFGLFLVYGSLTSSDFPRGLYGPPNNSEAHWDSIELLDANRLWNYNLNGNPSLAIYLSRCYNCSLKAVLTPPGDFYMGYYSRGEHHTYQAEWDFENSWDKITNDERPEYFYYFYHGADDDSADWRGALDSLPSGGASLKCTHAIDDSGTMLWGPNETLRDYGHDGNHGNQDRVSTADSQFCSLFRVMANLSGMNPADTVFRVIIRYHDPETLLKDTSFTGSSFGGVTSPNWKQFQVEYTLPEGASYVYYKIDWMDHCDFWVDYIEFYDMLRGRYLFEKDANGAYVYRNATLTQIADQCQFHEQQAYAQYIAAWKQPDEPLRCMYDAVGVINLMARDSLALTLQMPYSQLQDHCWYTQRPELFVLISRPTSVDPDIYPFKGPLSKAPGDQSELDTLEARIERCYQAAVDSSMPFHFTGQVHSWLDSGEVVWDLRDPHRSEILVETFMALAHGAISPSI